MNRWHLCSSNVITWKCALLDVWWKPLRSEHCLYAVCEFNEDVWDVSPLLHRIIKSFIHPSIPVSLCVFCPPPAVIHCGQQDRTTSWTSCFLSFSGLIQWRNYGLIQGKWTHKLTVALPFWNLLHQAVQRVQRGRQSPTSSQQNIELMLKRKKNTHRPSFLGQWIAFESLSYLTMCLV